MVLIKAAPQRQGFKSPNKTYQSQTWEKTTVATYTEGKLKVAFTNMLSPKGGNSRQTLSVFKGESEVTQFILDVQNTADQPKNDTTFTGTMSLYTMDGQLLSQATYKKSVRTALVETSLEKIKLPSSFSTKKKKNRLGVCRWMSERYLPIQTRTILQEAVQGLFGFTGMGQLRALCHLPGRHDSLLHQQVSAIKRKTGRRAASQPGVFSSLNNAFPSALPMRPSNIRCLPNQSTRRSGLDDT